MISAEDKNERVKELYERIGFEEKKIQYTKRLDD